MKSLKKSNIIYSVIISFVSLVLILSGCSNGLTAKQDNKKSADEILIQGSVSVPDAMPSSLRSAYSTFSTSTDGQIQIFASAEINGQVVFKKATVSDSNSFKLYIPKKDAKWFISAQICDKNGIPVMESQPQEKTVTASDDTITIEPFCLSVIDDSEQAGSVKLKFYNSNTTVSKIKWTIRPYKDYIQLDQSKKSGYIEFDPADNGFAYLQIEEIPAGTYKAAFYFVDSNDMAYGPVSDDIYVAPCFVTDTWFYSEDSFINSTGSFQVPSIDNLHKLFPNPTYSKPITGDTALLWSYDLTTFKPTYTVHPVTDTGISTTAYPVAPGVDVADVVIDFKTNDLYVLTKDNSVVMYTASSGYSESYTNTIENPDSNIILAMAASNGDAYVLAYNDNYQTYTILTFDPRFDELEYWDEVDLDFSGYWATTCKMTLCGNYLFIAYDLAPQLMGGWDHYSLACKVFDVDSIYEGNLWNEPFKLDYSTLYGENTRYEELFKVNDLIASENGSAFPDLYLMIGAFETEGTYGGILKLSTDESKEWQIDTDYGSGSSILRGFYYDQEVDAHCTPAGSTTYFFHPEKFIGKYNNEYLIADDGAIINGQYNEAKPPVFIASSAQNVNRVVSMNIFSQSFSSFGITENLQDENSSTFDNDYIDFIGMGVYQDINYPYIAKQMSGQGSQGGNISSSYADVSGDDFPVVDKVTIDLHKKRSNGYIENISIVDLPSTKNESLYIITDPYLPNATYEVALYCNGIDLNKDTSGNIVQDSHKYYTVDSTTGEFKIKRPLAVTGNKYILEIVVTVQNNVNGTPSTMHYDTSFEVNPATSFEINNPQNITDLNNLDYWDNFLIGDVANVVVTIDPANIQDSYEVTDYIRAIVNHFNDGRGPSLTLNFSATTGVKEITAGMFAIDCNRLVLPFKTNETNPDKNAEYGDYLITVKRDAFTDPSTGITFKGELVFSNDIVDFEPGAFSEPPRSIIIAPVGTNRKTDYDDGEGYPKFTLVEINSGYSGKDLLCKLSSSNEYIERVVTCTKRNEMYDVDFDSSLWRSVSQIDENAFKGLPVKTVKLGDIPRVSRGAFENTPVSSVEAKTYLQRVGYKAFPATTSLTIQDFDATQQQWSYYEYGTAENVDMYWSEAANDIYPGAAYDIGPESIIEKINEELGGNTEQFAFVKVID